MSEDEPVPRVPRVLDAAIDAVFAYGRRPGNAKPKRREPEPKG